MKKLNRKVFITIFSIISLFLVLSVVLFNIQTYKKEYDGVYRNLTFMDNNDNRMNPNDRNINVPFIVPRDKGSENMIFMDNDVYTVVLNNGQIEKVISHNGNSSDFDIESAIGEILSEDKGIKVGNLYSSDYSYNYKDNSIIIINNESINKSLIISLIESLILLLIGESVIYFIASFLTKRITKPAEESFAKQKDFIADASHELKTPLAVIMASSDELKEDKKNANYVNNIKQEAEKMNNLLKSMLDLSKLESGVTKDTYKEENLSKIINKTCLTFEAVAFEDEVQITSDIEDDIKFNCNKDEIERLISIILDNAIKHSNKKSIVKVITKKEKNNIVISITNSGDPIKVEDEEKIFERFYRADKSRNRNNNRYGLGLAIAKNIVINHNGSIKAHSDDGKTTFTIILKK